MLRRRTSSRAAIDSPPAGWLGCRDSMHSPQRIAHCSLGVAAGDACHSWRGHVAWRQVQSVYALPAAHLRMVMLHAQLISIRFQSHGHFLLERGAVLDEGEGIHAGRFLHAQDSIIFCFCFFAHFFAPKTAAAAFFASPPNIGTVRVHRREHIRQIPPPNNKIATSRSRMH